MDSRKVVHLFNLAHFGAFNPFSSKHAIVSGLYAFENGINLPAAYSHCDQCGVYQVAGLTSSVRIKYSKKAKPKAGIAKLGRRSRQLRITCLSCRYVKTHETLINRKALSSDSSDGSVDAGATKKKKNRKSELSKMLEEKKRMQNTPSSSLSLMEFMQS